MLLGPEWTWNWDWVGAVADLGRTLADAGRPARVVFVADPATALRLVETRAVEPSCSLSALQARGVTCVSLAPWRRSDVRRWLHASSGLQSLVGIDPHRLCDLTGNWPLLLESVVQDAGNTAASLESGLAAGIDGPFGALFGLDLPASRGLLDLLLEGGSPDIELAAERLPASLKWALLLHLARPVGNGRWRLDRVVARLL